MGPLHLVLEKAESQRCRQSRGEGLGGSAPGLGRGAGPLRLTAVTRLYVSVRAPETAAQKEEMLPLG